MPASRSRNVALGFRRHVAHSGGGLTSAIFAAEAPYRAMSSSTGFGPCSERASAPLEAHGHAREERRQHAVQVRARAAPVRDLARELLQGHARRADLGQRSHGGRGHSSFPLRLPGFWTNVG